MQLTFDFSAPVTQVSESTLRGQRAYASGCAAENAVERHYQRLGLQTAAKRWRKGGGELDLVMRQGAALVFVEVKKSASFARAAERVSPRQAQRILSGAAAFLANKPAGELTESRVDVALLNEFGDIRVLENALFAQ